MAANPSRQGSGALIQKPLTRDELLKAGEDEARRMLGKSLDEVFEMIDRGELEGTLAGAHFECVRVMLGP